MANIDTVTEYISVRVSSSSPDPLRLTMVWLKKSFIYYEKSKYKENILIKIHF